MQFVQAKILVLKLIHAAERVAQQLAQQHAHGPAVHAHKHNFILGPAAEQLDKRALAGSYLMLRRLGRCHPWCEGGCDPVPEHMPGLFTRLTSSQEKKIPS